MTKNEINSKLIDVFGYTVDGKPKFRLVFSDEETEVRIGEFDKYYGSIYVGKETGAKRIPKYSYLKGLYVLERLIPNYNPELAEPVSYEPIYVFCNANCEPLPLRWDVVEICCNKVLNPARREWRTEEMDRKEEERQFEQAKIANLAMLNERLPNPNDRTSLNKQHRLSITNSLETKNG